MLAPEAVRSTTAALMKRATLVHVDDAACVRLAETISSRPNRAEWDPADHFVDGGPATLRYLLVLDALNFCFWPDEGFEYGHLARGLREVAQQAPAELEASFLAAIDSATVAGWFGRELCLLDERSRLLRELGAVLLDRFEGQAIHLVRAACGSSARLAGLVAESFPGFRDHAVHGGRQVFLYKRAQIFAADVWGAFQGKGLGESEDIGALTTFADYRVPQILRAEGAIVVDATSAAHIEAGLAVDAGSTLEVEIRAATVQAVERIRHHAANHGAARSAVEIDWWLWHHAEATADDLPPHHRTLSLFY